MNCVRISDTGKRIRQNQRNKISTKRKEMASTEKFQRKVRRGRLIQGPRTMKKVKQMGMPRTEMKVRPTRCMLDRLMSKARI